MPNPEFPLSKETYRQAINGKAASWGQAHLTDVERDAIYQSKGKGSWSDVREALIKGEIPPPTITNENGVLDGKGFIELVASDACPVAYNLILLQGRTAESLIQSYTMKVRAYRFIAREIEDEEVFEAWRGMETKGEREVGVLELIRPEGMPVNQLVGKEKVACCFPCQLLKEIELIRTGKTELLEPTLGNPITLDNEERELLRIPWRDYQETIRQANCVEDIAINIAVETFKILREKGLDEEKIISLLFQGYSPRGLLLEQGQLSRITKIWGSIAAQLDMSYDIHLWQKFETVINRAIDEYNGRAKSLGIPLLNPYIKL